MELLKWQEFSKLVLDLGGILLLVLALYGASCVRGGLRIPALLIGVVAVIDILSITTQEGMSPARYLPIGDDPQDHIINMGYQNQGRVYLDPRVPRVSGSGTKSVEIRGAPGKKVIYWPSGGSGLGSSNDRLNVSEKRNPIDIRDSAMGCGIVVLDERGRGIALADKQCSHLLYREVTGSGYGGPLGKIYVGEDGSRGERSRKNSAGGMRPVGA